MDTIIDYIKWPGGYETEIEIRCDLVDEYNRTEAEKAQNIYNFAASAENCATELSALARRKDYESMNERAQDLVRYAILLAALTK